MKCACTVIVMAKAPAPGFAKTRLISALGALGAAQLATQLLNHAVAQALAATLGPVDLCCAPDPAHPAFAALAFRRGLRLTSQVEGDLGARMGHAFERGLALSHSVLMIGTDAPAVDAALLQTAAHALMKTDAVFVPALDGGYALIGLRQAAPSLFSNMRWSCASVMADTRIRLQALHMQHVELAAVADIDEPADLIHLPSSHLPLGGNEAPHSAPPSFTYFAIF